MRCRACPAQVSRRLTRRIKKALYDKQLGYVKIAVAAYVHLLDASAGRDASYTFNYFSKELIHQPDTVVSGAGRAAGCTTAAHGATGWMGWDGMARSGNLGTCAASMRAWLCRHTRCQPAVPLGRWAVLAPSGSA